MSVLFYPLFCLLSLIFTDDDCESDVNIPMKRITEYDFRDFIERTDLVKTIKWSRTNQFAYSDEIDQIMYEKPPTPPTTMYAKSILKIKC